MDFEGQEGRANADYSSLTDGTDQGGEDDSQFVLVDFRELFAGGRALVAKGVQCVGGGGQRPRYCQGGIGDVAEA